MNHLLEVIFSGWRKSGKLDLEAVETATRTTMHRAGAAVLSELLSSSEAAPLMSATRPRRKTWRRISETEKRESGQPDWAGSSQARALTATTS